MRYKRTADGLNLYAFADSAAPDLQSDIVRFHDGRFYVWVGDKMPRRRAFTYVRIGKLLGDDNSSLKLAKTRKRFAKSLSVIYYGAPFNLASLANYRINKCRFASCDCAAFCLNLSGKRTLPSVQLTAVARTRFETFQPLAFWRQFEKELDAKLRKADREGKQLYCRPNGTTDERTSHLMRIIRSHPTVKFLDYTAVPSALNCELPNYELTFSRKETRSNLAHCLEARRLGHNLAIVATKEVKEILLRCWPETYVDFDVHDLRLREVDGSGIIGVLTPKGQMRGKVANDSMVYGTVARVRNELEFTRGEVLAHA